MQVHEVMTSSPLSVSIRTSIRQAWEALESQDVRHLPVINEDRELVGMLSDRDFRGRPPGPLTDVLGPGQPSASAPVAAIMTAEPFAVEQDDSIQDVIELMVENKIGAVPVTTPEGHVIGIVSYLDLLRKLGPQLE
jgi:acetoin utilization protein AcuB